MPGESSQKYTQKSIINCLCGYSLNLCPIVVIVENNCEDYFL